MYRTLILLVLISCSALLSFAGCSQIDSQKKADVVDEEAAPAEGPYEVEDVEKEAKEHAAKEQYKQGILARQANDLIKARECFEGALELNPSYMEAAQALAEVKIALGEAAPDSAAGVALHAKKVEAAMKLIRHEVQATISQAESYYRQEKYDEVIDGLEEALGLMKWATKLYMLDFSSERDIARELLKTARMQRDVFIKSREAEQRKQAEREIAEELRRQADYRKRLADELLILARQGLEKKNFAEALKFMRRALLKDPGNSEAMMLEKIIVRERISFERERILLRTDMAWRRSFFKMEEAALPIAGIMNWPDREEWLNMSKLRRERSEREQKVFERTPEQENIEKKLEDTTVRLLKIESKRFPDAMKTIMKQFGDVVPIVLHPGVFLDLEDVKIGFDRSVETNLKTAIEIALDKIPDEYGKFTYIIKDEAVLITPKGAEETKRLIIYPVQDLLRNLVPFSPPSVDINREDLFKTSGEFGDVGDEDPGYFGTDDLESQGEYDFQDPDDLEPDSLKELIVNTLGGGPDKWNFDDGNPGAPSTIDFRKGNMFISATEAIHKNVQKTLSDIRSTSEVLVTLEARFLDVYESLLEEIGVDLRGNPTEFRQMRAAELGLDFTDPFLEGWLNDLGVDPLDSGLFFGKRGSGIGYTTDGERIYLTRGVPNGDAMALRSENILDETLGKALEKEGGLTAGFALRPGDSRINFVLKTLINSKRTTMLSAPKITTYNHQQAYIAIIKEQRFIGSVKEGEKTDPSDPPSVDPVPSLLSSGIVLAVKPNVTWDRKYVILDVVAYATIGTLGPTVPLDLSPPAGRVSQNNNPIDQPKLIVEFNFPEIKTQHVKTTVMIPDGGTVILGGLSHLQSNDGSASTPLLGDIPIVKFFFSRKGTQRERASLIIMLRADITVVPEQERRFLDDEL